MEFDGTWGRLVGEPGRGVPTILEMVGHTRLDCTIGSAAGMRMALAQAVHHARHRSAFGRLLVDQPLMANVLADLALESEAATALALRLARAYDEEDVPLRRLGTAVAKFHVCKRFPALAAEALECLGGNGYVEESGLPRLYREAPLNSVWEGSGNLTALDVLRTLTRSRRRSTPCSPSWARRAAPTRATTPGSTACEARSRTRRRSSSAPAAWSRTWRSPGRPGSSCATHPTPWATRSWPRASAATAA